jgi:hypothetical protein
LTRGRPFDWGIRPGRLKYRTSVPTGCSSGKGLFVKRQGQFDFPATLPREDKLYSAEFSLSFAEDRVASDVCCLIELRSVSHEAGGQAGPREYYVRVSNAIPNSGAFDGNPGGFRTSQGIVKPSKPYICAARQNKRFRHNGRVNHPKWLWPIPGTTVRTVGRLRANDGARQMVAVNSAVVFSSENVASRTDFFMKPAVQPRLASGRNHDLPEPEAGRWPAACALLRLRSVK